MNERRREPWESSLPYYLVTALSLSIGWGIRGNFGHEYGAMIPGALAAMAAVLLSGRSDWLKSIPFFAMFGALGWSFGGSISYMQVVGYTHSGHSLSVLYGFACLFVIGFLWAVLGGAGTALSAVADRRRLTDLFPALGLVFVFWWLQGLVIEPWLRGLGYSLYWYDTDWLAALLAIVAAVLLALVRRQLDRSTGLVLCLAGGWWAGFGMLVLCLGLHMTPPRGDNWAGCLGMTVGAIIYCTTTGLAEVAQAAVVSGFIGGIGFASASMLKLVEVTSGYSTNWHSIMEQTTGFFNGIGLAVALRPLAVRPGRVDGDALEDATALPCPWAESVAVGFVLLVIPYLNLRKNVRDWVQAHAVPEIMYGIPAWLWFDMATSIVALGMIVLLVRHGRRRLAIVPNDDLGRGQALYLLFLAIMVIGNFERALVGFAAQRLVTEGVILVEALLCAVLLLTMDMPWRVAGEPAEQHADRVSIRWGRLTAAGLAAALTAIVLDWAIVRGIYGDRFAGHSGLHIRFGPGATIHPPNRGTTPKPS
jgi:hypothetical protein